MNLSKKTLLASVALLCSLTSLQAQSPWLNNSGPSYFSFEFSKPSFADGVDLNFFSGVYDLSGSVQMSKKSELIVDIPIAHFGLKDNDFDVDSETTIGNIYLGIRTGDRASAVRGEFGVLLPTASDKNQLASTIGVYTLPNQELGFAPNLWGLKAKIRAEDLINDNGLFYRGHGGLTYGNFSNDVSDLTILYLDYLAQIGVRSNGGFAGVLGLSGRTALNDDSKYDDDDSSSFLFGLGISYRTNNFEPGLTIKLPLDDPYKEAVDNVISVSFLFHLGE